MGLNLISIPSQPFFMRTKTLITSVIYFTGEEYSQLELSVIMQKVFTDEVILFSLSVKLTVMFPVTVTFVTLSALLVICSIILIIGLHGVSCLFS